MGRSIKRQLADYSLSIKDVYKKRIYKVPGIIIIVFLIMIIMVPLPDPLFNNPYSTTIRSAENSLLSVAIADDYQWRFPPSDSIPLKFETCMRLFEDEYFYYHPGINPVSIVRAMYQNIKAGKIISGGSTISMQTVRMAFGNKERTYFQKMIEMLATIKLELFYSKKEILIQHASNAPFGGNIVGLKAASWRYFGREPHQLSWSETAFLAVLPNNPSEFTPHKVSLNYLAKRNFLLDKLNNRGFLTDDEVYLAKQEKLPRSLKSLPNHAYHLLYRAINEGKKGRNIHSTIQYDLQKELNYKVNTYSKKMTANHIYNGAAIVIDISSGNTLAYTGNSNSQDDHGQHVDIITSRRSPGSLLKPILYASSLDDGLILPYQLLPDIPIFYKDFTPQNFDKKFRGAVHANEALASSLNIPFVYLLREFGYEKFHHKIKKIGLLSWDRPARHYGLSMILGGAEASLWEMSAFYVSLARVYNNYSTRATNKKYSLDDYHPNYYLKEKNKLKETSFDNSGPLSAIALGYTFRAMQQLRRPEQEAGWQLFGSSRPIAWKTGTSFGFRDAWAIGFNNKYLVGIWIGNADGEGRPGLTGVVAASPLMFDVFDLLDGDANFEDLYGFESKICTISGMNASKKCNETKEILLPEILLDGNQCTYHQVIHLNKEQNKRVNSSCYPVSQIENVNWFLLPPVQSWYYKKYNPHYNEPPPYLKGCSNYDKEKTMQLIYPSKFTNVFVPLEQDGQKGSAIFEAAHINAESKIFWHLDNNFLGTTKRFHQMGIQAEKGEHILTLVDGKGNILKRSFYIIN